MFPSIGGSLACPIRVILWKRAAPTMVVMMQNMMAPRKEKKTGGAAMTEFEDDDKVTRYTLRKCR